MADWIIIAWCTIGVFNIASIFYYIMRLKWLITVGEAILILIAGILGPITLIVLLVGFIFIHWHSPLISKTRKK